MRQIVLRHPGTSEINWLWSTDVTGGEMVSLYTILQNYSAVVFQIHLKFSLKTWFGNTVWAKNF